MEIEWLTAQDMADREQVDRSTVLRRAKNGLYQVKEDEEGKKWYAKVADPGKPVEQTADVVENEFGVDASNMYSCQNCGQVIMATKESVEAFTENNLALIKARTALLMGRLKANEDIETRTAILDSKQKELEQKETELASREAEAAKEYNEAAVAVAQVTAKEKELKIMELRLNREKSEWEIKKPEVVTAEKQKKIEDFQDYAYDRYETASGMGCVIVIGYSQYHGLYGISYDEAVKAWYDHTAAWKRQ